MNTQSEMFLEQIREAGLAEALEKMSSIALDTLGYDLKEMIAGEKPIHPVWQVLYQDRWMEKNGEKFYVLINPNATGGWASGRTFPTLEAAKAELEKLLRERNRGARVEKSICGDFGMDIVIDEETAEKYHIVHWKIRRQYKSGWEITEET